ncbi:MAG: hypothetical protein ABW277_26515 [Longimicrobiaceae bacterium]
MRLSFSYLRRGILGLAFAGSLGFGAAQAVASEGSRPLPRTCPPRSYEYVTPDCNAYCNGPGFCATNGYCQCGPLP